jgi:hypothetical protein
LGTSIFSGCERLEKLLGGISPEEGIVTKAVNIRIQGMKKTVDSILIQFVNVAQNKKWRRTRNMGMKMGPIEY